MLNTEDLGPAERIIQALLAYQDHMVHNRPGVVRLAPGVPYGKSWTAATYRLEDGEEVAYLLTKSGKRETKTRLGVIDVEGRVVEAGRVVGLYRQPGLFPEVATWMYRQCADVWALDNEFAARWASKAYTEEQRDLKVVLCALMLVQNRRGDRVGDLRDADYRDVGEAMALLRRKDKRDVSPKLLLRVGDVLALPEVAAINRELGFGRSPRNPALGRYHLAVEKYLRHREDNPGLLADAVKAGWSGALRALARRVGYKPSTPAFFRALRWEQKQAEDGRREVAVGEKLGKAETWESMSEEAVCEAIVATRPDWKAITGRLPASVGVTRAVVAAALESGGLSDKDLVNLTPTLEGLGLLGDAPGVAQVRARWAAAVKKSEDLRGLNIAKNVRSQAVKDVLVGGADAALQKSAEESTRGMRVYAMLDISGSMQGAIAAARAILPLVLAGIPLERFHLATFNTVGRLRTVMAPTQAGVDMALSGISAGGGTTHAGGIIALTPHQPKPDEDSLLVVVGDGGEHGDFAAHVRASGLRPQAIGFVEVPGRNEGCVERTAEALGIPCFKIDRKTFEGTYEVPRVLRRLITATPVRQGPRPAGVPVRRLALVEQVLATPLLVKPVWA